MIPLKLTLSGLCLITNHRPWIFRAILYGCWLGKTPRENPRFLTRLSLPYLTYPDWKNTSRRVDKSQFRYRGNNF